MSRLHASGKVGLGQAEDSYSNARLLDLFGIYVGIYRYARYLYILIYLPSLYMCVHTQSSRGQRSPLRTAIDVAILARDRLV